LELENPAPSSSAPSIPGHLREWLDALVFAFILAMFIRVFMVELFKIPSSSMTPTLIGGLIARLDANDDGLQDLLLLRGEFVQPLLFLNDGRRLVGQGEVPLPPLDSAGSEFDKILVNKMAYWFSAPRRGDIVVFKVPERLWVRDPDKSIYIKRCVGEPGDALGFDAQGHLQVGGRSVTQPDFFRTQRYRTVLPRRDENLFKRPEIRYDTLDDDLLAIERIDVPDGEIYVFGDNTHGSLDSRYWGGVPIERIKGRAFLRCWPWGQMSFLKGR
jgi:signal peptidase I